MITTPTTNINAVHVNSSQPASQNACSCYLALLHFLTPFGSSQSLVNSCDAGGSSRDAGLECFLLSILFPALGLVFPDQPFLAGQVKVLVPPRP